MPESFVRFGTTWQAHHPGWEMKLWTDDNLPDLGPWDVAYRQGRNPAEKSDVLRYFLVHRFGGVYIDTDFECLRNIEPLLDDQSFVTAREAPDVVAPGFFAAARGHPVLDRLLDGIRSGLDLAKSQSETAGPTYFTRVVSGERSVSVCPTAQFYPYPYRDRGNPPPAYAPDVYAVHHWAHSWSPDPDLAGILETDAFTRGGHPLLAESTGAAPRSPAEQAMVIAIVCVYFNPCGYKSLLENYRLFCKQFEGLGLPIFTVELAYGDTFECPNAFLSIKGNRDTQFLWQKERLINRAVEMLDAKYEAVAYVDADVLFTNPDWLAEAQDKLRRSPVVQLFSSRILLNASHEVEAIVESAARGFRASRDHKIETAPGCAWAVRRELFPIIDYIPTGSADLWQYLAWHPRPSSWPKLLLSNAMQRRYDKDRARCRPLVGGRIDCVYGSVIHYWHGSYRNRRYGERTAIERDHTFDPDRDIAIAPNGAWEWSSDKPLLHAAVRDYFFGRREDERDRSTGRAVFGFLLNEDIEALREGIRDREQTLNRVLRTRSWRYTGWIRKLESYLRSQNGTAWRLLRQTSRSVSNIRYNSNKSIG